MAAAPLEWTDGDAKALRDEQFGDAPIDVLIACDCVFELLWSEFLILNMLRVLAAPHTLCYVALERRAHDGVERFVHEAAKDFNVELAWCLGGDQTTVCIFCLTLKHT